MTRIVGVGNQRVKECNRIAAMVQALQARLNPLSNSNGIKLQFVVLCSCSFVSNCVAGVRDQSHRATYWHRSGGGADEPKARAGEAMLRMDAPVAIPI